MGVAPVGIDAAGHGGGGWVDVLSLLRPGFRTEREGVCRRSGTRQCA